MGLSIIMGLSGGKVELLEKERKVPSLIRCGRAKWEYAPRREAGKGRGRCLSGETLGFKSDQKNKHSHPER